MSRFELLTALVLVAGIVGMFSLGMYFANQQAQRGREPAETVRDVIP